MASNPESAAPRLRWGRALVAALVAEFALVCVAIPIYATAADATALLNMVVPPASGILFLIAGYWAALPIRQRGLAQGTLTGVWAVGLYLVLGVVASLFVPGTSVTDGFTPAYLTAHVLKIVGGAIGGWLASRKAASAA
jgi:hypothetical protein